MNHLSFSSFPTVFTLLSFCFSTIWFRKLSNKYATDKKEMQTEIKRYVIYVVIRMSTTPIWATWKLVYFFNIHIKKSLKSALNFALPCKTLLCGASKLIFCIIMNAPMLWSKTNCRWAHTNQEILRLLFLKMYLRQYTISTLYKVKHLKMIPSTASNFIQDETGQR